MWGSQGVGWSHLRGPCRRKKPLPLARVEVKIKIKAMKIMIIIMIMMQVNLLFEACMRHETLWQLLVQKGIKYHCHHYYHNQRPGRSCYPYHHLHCVFIQISTGTDKHPTTISRWWLYAGFDDKEAALAMLMPMFTIVKMMFVFVRQTQVIIHRKRRKGKRRKGRTGMWLQRNPKSKVKLCLFVFMYIYLCIVVEHLLQKKI